MIIDNKLLFLINALIHEQPNYKDIQIPENIREQKQLLRSLMNVRSPMPLSEDIMEIQDDYLREEINKMGITDFDRLLPEQGQLYLWKGDITTLRVDAIVNAANSQMLGCFVPCHACIDNAIHTFAGVQLRLICDNIMKKQCKPEETGKVKITPAYNLPSKYVLHTVGPIVNGKLTEKDCELLASCYHSCLELAEQNNINSIAFCCISTGEFHFPNEIAARIAVNTVKNYINNTESEMKVIFNVFKEKDYGLYQRLLKINETVTK